jgi:alanine racemase
MSAAVLTIDLGAITANWRALAGRHAGATAGVVKADAYGLGAARVVPALHGAGCRQFFVAQLDEAMAIRPLAPGCLVAVLNGLAGGRAAEYADHDITPVIGSLGELGVWRATAGARGVALPVILHADTGMTRLGFAPADLATLRAQPDRLEGLRPAYLMTHLACADEPADPFNAVQAQRFAAIAAQFPGVPTSLANSSGLFLGPRFGSALARPGAALYGINPMPGAANPMAHAVTLSAPILQIREIAAGESVGYGRQWVAARPSRIAILGVGYADGYHRALSNTSTARFDGMPVPLVGRVSMDLTTFDVTEVPAQPGDHLTLIGPHYGPDALAIDAGTNGYEILTSLGRRYQRRYIAV